MCSFMGGSQFYDRFKYWLFVTALLEDSNWLQIWALQVGLWWRETQGGWGICDVNWPAEAHSRSKAESSKQQETISVCVASLHQRIAQKLFDCFLLSTFLLLCQVIPASFWAFLLSGVFASQREYWEIPVAQLASIKPYILYIPLHYMV